MNAPQSAGLAISAAVSAAGLVKRYGELAAVDHEPTTAPVGVRVSVPVLELAGELRRRDLRGNELWRVSSHRLLQAG